MKERIFRKLMKLIALFNIFIFLFPTFIVLRYLLFDTMGGILEFVFPLFSMYLGLVATSLICKKEYYFTTRLLSYTAVLIPAISCGFIYTDRGIARSLVESTFVGIFYIIGSINYPKSYQDTFSPKVLSFSMILLTITMFLASSITILRPARATVFIFILIYILLTMLIKSEENIDEVFMYRGVEIPEVQRSIRKQNSKLIILLYGVILIMFNIKDFLAATLKFLLLIYVKASIFVMYLLSKLLSTSDGGSSDGGSQAQQLPFEPGKSDKFLNYLFTAIAVIIIIFAIYKALPKVIKAISQFIAYVKALFTRVLKIKENKYDDSECVEIVEITKQTVDNKVKKKKKINLISILKKTTDPTKRIRLMYQIILSEFGRRGIDIAASDTTGQVVEKAAGIELVENEIENITSIYEKVRYGEEPPQNQALTSMEEGYIRILSKPKG